MTKKEKAIEPEAVWRLHYIRERAELKKLKQSDLVRATGANKGTVSRWFAGSLPRDEYLPAITSFFGLDQPSRLFLPPEDDWIIDLTRGRTAEELKKIQATIEAAFPRKPAKA